MPEWDVVLRIVLILDGVPDYFTPLWKEALTHERNLEPTPANPPAHTQAAPLPTQRLDDLVTAFSDTLTAPLQHLGTAETGSPPGPAPTRPGDAVQRRSRPAPTPALSYWNAR